MTQPLVQAASSLAGQPSSVRIGTVADTTPLTVSVQGAVFTDVGILGSFSPILGQAVALLGQSPASGSDPTSWLVLGDIHPEAWGYQAGEELITFVAQTSFTLAVTFDHPFPSPPIMSANIATTAGAAANWHARAAAVSTTGFTLFVFGPSSTWTDIPVQWHAHVATQ